MGKRLLAVRNVFKAVLLLGGWTAIFTALGWWLGDFRLASVFFVVSLLMTATVYWYGPRILLAALGARELAQAEAPLLRTTVERLAADARVSQPKLYLLPDGFPRSFSVGRGPRDFGIAISEGLVTLTTPAELQGIIAHEIAHARHRDVSIQTPTVLAALWLVEASRIGGFLQRALLFVLAPLAASLVHLLLSPKRELAADAFAASLCGSPHGLADALIRLEQAIELIEFRASPATEPLYIVNPFGTEKLASMFNTHPTVSERVARLRAIDPDWREKLRAA